MTLPLHFNIFDPPSLRSVASLTRLTFFSSLLTLQQVTLVVLPSLVALVFDTDHQGWRCRTVDERCLWGVELALHVRGHFYVYSKDLRYLPTSDVEASLKINLQLLFRLLRLAWRWRQ